MKERMITQLLNTVKEMTTVNISQSTKPRPIFTCENETKVNNVSDIKTNQSERKRSIGVTSNGNTVTNSQALPLDRTHLDAVRGLIQTKRFRPSASTRRAQ